MNAKELRLSPAALLAEQARQREARKARSRRVAPKGKASRDKKQAAREARSERAAEIRAAVMARAEGRCEWCRAWGTGLVLEWHHIIGGGLRRKRESVETTAAICHQCHREWERSVWTTLHDALAWSLRLGLQGAQAAIKKRISKVEEARNRPTVPVRLVTR